MRLPLLISALGATVAFACACPQVVSVLPPSAQIHTIPEPVAEAAKNVWILMVQQRVTTTKELPDGTEISLSTIRYSHGTAFPVQQIDGRVLLMTARHVVDSHGGGEIVDITARQACEFLEEGEVVQLHKIEDVALVAFESSPGEVKLHTIDRRIPRFGEIVYAAGYPANMGRLFLGMGVISDPDINTISVYPGSSGSPVFGADGGVIALVSQIGIGLRGEPVLHTCLTVLMKDL